MANEWFRMYHEFSSDAKVQMMSEQYQRRLIMLFCLRCNGHVTLHDSEVAFQLRIGDVEWAETKREFIARGFINETNEVLKWDKRQYRSDSSAERVRRHRASKRNATVTKCNVTVTPPDTDTDTEYKKELSDDNSKKPVNQKISKPDEVSEQVWLDFLQLRKAKRAALTATALDGIRREAVKAGMSLNEALATSCRRGWQGFEAVWLQNEKLKPGGHFQPRRGEPLKQNVVTL